jgi:hypothetical protein
MSWYIVSNDHDYSAHCFWMVETDADVSAYLVKVGAWVMARPDAKWQRIPKIVAVFPCRPTMLDRDAYMLEYATMAGFMKSLKGSYCVPVDDFPALAA